MVKRAIFVSFFTFLFCNVLCVSGRMSKKLYPPMKEDVPFIKCDVCQKGMKYLYRKAKSMRDESVTKKVEEEKLQELVEKACNPEKFEGEWIAKLDIEEEDDELKVIEHDNLGSCRAECRTVAKACEETVGEAEVDIAEELWKDELSLSKLINQVCYSDTKACSKNPAKFESGTREDETFQIMSEDEKKAQEYMKRAGDMPGMPNMQMYSREEMEKMVKAESKKEASSEESSSHTSSNDHSKWTIIWQTIVQVVQDVWEWLKSIFGFKRTSTEEL